jgi:hypothetical protein
MRMLTFCDWKAFKKFYILNWLNRSLSLLFCPQAPGPSKMQSFWIMWNLKTNSKTSYLEKCFSQTIHSKNVNYSEKSIFQSKIHLKKLEFVKWTYSWIPIEICVCVVNNIFVGDILVGKSKWLYENAISCWRRVELKRKLNWLKFQQLVMSQKSFIKGKI